MAEREGRDNIKKQVSEHHSSPSVAPRCQTKLQHLSVFPFLLSVCPPVFIFLAQLPPLFSISLSHFSLPHPTPSFSQHQPLPHELWISNKLCSGALPTPAYQTASSVTNFVLPKRPPCPLTQGQIEPQQTQKSLLATINSFFLMNWTFTCQKWVKSAHHNFPRGQGDIFKWVFCMANHPKPAKCFFLLSPTAWWCHHCIRC